MNKWCAWFDGAVPDGVPCFGAVLRVVGAPDCKTANGPVKLLGDDMTTNVAEYGGLIGALELAEAHVPNGDIVEVRGDSQLVVRQVNGQYRVKKQHLVPYVSRAKEMIERLRARGISVILNWVPREENTQADELSKKKPKSAWKEIQEDVPPGLGRV